jgi:hypothetical protein
VDHHHHHAGHRTQVIYPANFITQKVARNPAILSSSFVIKRLTSESVGGNPDGQYQNVLKQHLMIAKVNNWRQNSRHNSLR